MAAVHYTCNALRSKIFKEAHGEKFWTRTRNKYTDLGEFETINMAKKNYKTLIGKSQQYGLTTKLF